MKGTEDNFYAFKYVNRSDEYVSPTRCQGNRTTGRVSGTIWTNRVTAIAVRGIQ